MTINGKCGIDATYEFNVDTGVLTISGAGAIRDHAFDTENAKAPEWGFALEIATVIIKDGITEIGDYAFSGTRIKRISIPKSVMYVGSYAFHGIPNFVKTSIPEDAITINYGKEV